MKGEVMKISGLILITFMGGFIFFWIRGRALRKREEEAERVRTKFEFVQRQKKFAKSLKDEAEREINAKCKEALGAYLSIATSLIAAEDFLDQANKEFSERAFSPFWEAIENALLQLAGAENSVRYIRHLFSDYLILIRQNSEFNNKFPVNLSNINEAKLANGTQQRMRLIIRKAQKDFHFATIFEQRRNTNVLIDGFQNLSQAIDGLGDRLISSIDNFSGEIARLQREVNERNTVRDSINATRHEDINTYASKHLALARKQFLLLESMQKQRR